MSKKLMEDQNFVARFMREAQAAAAVSHTNLAQIYELDEQDGLHYFVMEYIEGVTVEELLEKETIISPLQALDITRQSATGLMAAAAKGLIHRDIKPSNILIDKNNVIKLVDFGLAKAMEDSSQLTQTDMILGTPHYVSPEQARGEKNIDFRSDMYSLGVTLFSMVTGQLPFTATTPMGVMLRHVNDEPPQVTKLRPHIPQSLGSLINKVLSKSPDDRFESYEKLISSIDKITTEISDSKWSFDKAAILSTEKGGIDRFTESGSSSSDDLSGETRLSKTPATVPGGGLPSGSDKTQISGSILKDQSAGVKNATENTLVTISRIEKGARGNKTLAETKVEDTFIPLGGFFKLLWLLLRHPLDGWKKLYKLEKLNWLPLFAFTIPLLLVFCGWAEKIDKAYSDGLFISHMVSFLGILPLMLFIPKDFKFGRFKGAMYATMLTWISTIPCSFPAGRLLLILFPILLYGSLTRFLQIEGKRKYIIFLLLFILWGIRGHIANHKGDLIRFGNKADTLASGSATSLKTGERPTVFKAAGGPTFSRTFDRKSC
jgi:serine/threonine protein kinase